MQSVFIMLVSIFLSEGSSMCVAINPFLKSICYFNRMSQKKMGWKYLNVIQVEKFNRRFFRNIFSFDTKQNKFLFVTLKQGNSCMTSCKNKCYIGFFSIFKFKLKTIIDCQNNRLDTSIQKNASVNLKSRLFSSTDFFPQNRHKVNFFSTKLNANERNTSQIKKILFFCCLNQPMRSSEEL